MSRARLSFVLLLLSGCIPTESTRTGGDTPPPRLDADASTVELVEPEPVWTAQQVVANAQTVAASRYVVQPGDTLRGIGNRTGAGSEMIARVNGLTPPFALRVGQAWLPWPLKGLVAPVVYSLFDDDALFLAAVGARKPPRWFAALVRGGLRAHGWLRRGTRLGAYPLRLADTPNRTYPGNRYSIEQLKPVHLQRVEGEAPSGTPGDAEAAVAPAGRCPFA